MSDHNKATLTFYSVRGFEYKFQIRLRAVSLLRARYSQFGFWPCRLTQPGLKYCFLHPKVSELSHLFMLILSFHLLLRERKKNLAKASNMEGCLHARPRPYSTVLTSPSHLTYRTEKTLGTGVCCRSRAFLVSWNAIADRPKKEDGATFSVFCFNFSFNSGLLLYCYQWSNTCCDLAWHG